MHRSREKEETRSKKTFDSDRRRKEKSRCDKTEKMGEVKKGDFYRILQSNGRSGTGRIVEVGDREIKLSEYTDSEHAVAYEYSIKIENIRSIEPMVASIRKESSNTKNNVVIVTMTTGTMGYGELVKETSDELTMTNFVFFSDGSIPYGITVKKELVREFLRLSAPLKEAEEEFKTDAEIGRKKNEQKGQKKEMESFYQSTKEPEYQPKEKQEKWNQFAENEKLFGLKATFDESMYTTVLDKNSKEYKEYAQEAEDIARRIDKPVSSNAHLEEERGRISDRPEDEKYSTAAIRQKQKKTQQSKTA
ncbi:hypothetical protein NEMIN01_1125, partial [Nematocida minor]|uniref:uncharacterized protein n=1 Tax=Nematocida minor TaxID=1912983 RepID=UPI002220BBFC